MTPENHIVPSHLRAIVAVTVMLLSHPGFALNPDVSLSQYAHEHWDSKDGLPEGGIFSLYHDDTGFLWVGSKQGLVRFDGRNFKRFALSASESNSYSFVREIIEGADGTLWAAVVGGVVELQGTELRLYGDAEGLAHPFAYSIAQDNHGNIWTGTGGAGIWQLTDGQFLLHPAYETADVPVQIPVQINDMIFMQGEKLWAATDRGIVVFKRDGGGMARMIQKSNGLPSNVVNALYRTKSGNVWAATRRGPAKLDNDGNVVAVMPGLQNSILSIMADGDGVVWCGTDDGLIVRLSASSAGTEVKDFLDMSSPVFSIAEDRNGAVWVGTDSGLDRFYSSPIVTFGALEGLDEENILNISRHPAGGLVVLDGKGAIWHFCMGDISPIAPEGIVSGQGMLGMTVLADGSTYVGGKTLKRIHHDTVTHYTHPGGEFVIVAPWRNKLLVAQTALDGISTLSQFDNGVFVPFFLNKEIHHIQRVFVDSRERIWVSTGGDGVWLLSDSGIVQYTKDDGLPHNIAYSFVEDTFGNIWVSTRAGLARINENGLRFLSEYPELQRAPTQMAVDDQGYLWVTTYAGVFRASLNGLNESIEIGARTATLRRYSLKEGMRGREVSWRPGGIARTNDGHVWLATNRGLTEIHPDLFQPLKLPKKLIIDRMLVNGVPVSVDSENPLVLKSGDKQLEFQYTAPILDGADGLSFDYRLVGYDSGWVTAGNRTKVWYTNVPSGEYRFQVRVSRPGRTGHVEAISDSFVIMPFWWETLGARVVFVFLGILLLLGIHRMRVRQLRLREKALAREVAERTRDLEVLNTELEDRVLLRTSELEGANRELANEKEQLSVTLRSLSQGVVTIDRDNRIVLVNDFALQMVGCMAPNIVGEKVEKVFRLKDRFSFEPIPLPIQYIDDSSSETDAAVRRAVLVNPMESLVLVDCAAAPIRNHDGEKIGAVLVLSDVTLRTTAEEKLQQSQKLEALTVLAGGIAHDFNNMITGIVGYMDLAQRTIGKDHIATKWLSSSVEITDNARNLTQQLKSFASGTTLTTASHSLLEIVGQSRQFVLSGSQVVCELSADSELRPCDVDPQQMRQVFDNLILNARQSMADGGLLTIQMRNYDVTDDAIEDLDKGQYVEVILSDTGEGIPPSVLNRVFDPFFTTRANGTGLGLATVQSIVTRHGGHISVNSLSGNGTTFRILLRAAHTEPVASVVAPPVEAISSVQGNILVVEHDENIRRITRIALEHCGFHVAVATRADEIETLINDAGENASPFSLAIVGFTIPGGKGGAEVLRILKTLDPNIRVVVTSGYTKEEVMNANDSSYQFDGFLSKPYTIDTLIAEVTGFFKKPSSDSEPPGSA